MHAKKTATTALTWSCLIALFSVCCHAGQKTIKPEFDLTAGLANWVTRDAKVSAAGDGRGFLVSTSKYVEGETSAWPAVMWRSENGPEDWSPYDELRIVMENPHSHLVATKIRLAEKDSDKFYFQFVNIPPQSKKAFKINLNRISIDKCKISGIDLFTSKPYREYTFRLESIKLISHAPEKVAEMRLRLSEIKMLMTKDTPVEVTEACAFYENSLNAAAAVFAPGRKVKNSDYERLSLMESAFSSWYIPVQRRLFGEFCAAGLRKQFPGVSYGLGLADSMDKVMIVDRALDNVKPLTNLSKDKEDTTFVGLCGNEYEAGQLVILCGDKPLENLTLSLGEFVGEGGAKLTVESGLVGYVKTAPMEHYTEYSGWWPDPILEFQKTVSLSPGEAAPFWIRFYAPKGTPGGIYRGTIRLSGEEEPDVEVPLSVRVFGFDIPARPEINISMSFGNRIKRVYGALSPKRYGEILDGAAKLLSKNKMGLDGIYRSVFAAPVKDDPANMRQFLYIDELKRLKKLGELNKFCLGYLLIPRKVDGIRDITDFNIAPDDPRVDKAIEQALRYLRYWVPEMRKEGLLKYAYLYGFDEYPPRSFPAVLRVCKAIKAEFPELPIASTAYDHSFGTDSVFSEGLDIFVRHTAFFASNLSNIAKARKNGQHAWWYVTCAYPEPYANLFVEYPGTHPRLLMGLMTAKFRPEGFLLFDVDRFAKDNKPIASGPYTDWNSNGYGTFNGEGCLVAAGKDGYISTIRLENFRDGVEDYSYICKLEKLLSLSDKHPEGTAELSRAGRKNLQKAISLVPDIDSFSYSAIEIRTARRKMAESLEQLSATLKNAEND